MFGFNLLKINRIKNVASYFNLLNFQDEKDLTNIIKIVNIFELNETPLMCIMQVPNDSEFLELPNKEFAIDVKSTSKLLFNKKPQCNIEVKFNGINLETLIRLASKTDDSLYVIPQDKNNHDIEFILNNNDHNYINFSTKSYNIKDIKTKIKEILK